MCLQDWTTCSKYVKYVKFNNHHNDWGDFYDHFMSTRIFSLIINRIFM